MDLYLDLYPQKKRSLETTQDPIYVINGDRVKLLGQGGKGYVYLARLRDSSGNVSDVAAKRLPVIEWYCNDRNNFKRMLGYARSEIRTSILCTVYQYATGRLICPTLFGCFGYNGSIYLLFEKMDCTCAEYIMKLAPGIPRVGGVKVVVKGLADRLENLHQLGIVHRDIKPANVLMKDN